MQYQAQEPRLCFNGWTGAACGAPWQWGESHDKQQERKKAWIILQLRILLCWCVLSSASVPWRRLGGLYIQPVMLVSIIFDSPLCSFLFILLRYFSGPALGLHDEHFLLGQYVSLCPNRAGQNGKNAELRCPAVGLPVCLKYHYCLLSGVISQVKWWQCHTETS